MHKVNLKKLLQNNWVKLTLSGFIILLLVSLFATGILFQVSNHWDKTCYRVHIPKQTTLGEVSKALAEKRIVRSELEFKMVAQIQDLDKKLQAGTYDLSPSQSLWAILSTLSKGKIVPALLVTVTIPEGSSIREMASLFAAAGLADITGFEDLASMPIPAYLKAKYPFLKKIKIDSLEGYLFPDTYKITQRADRWLMAEAMLDRFRELVLPVYQQKQGWKYDLHRVLSLAAIIEKEAVVSSEQRLISGVFYNRLRQGMRLRADPTVKYVLKKPPRYLSYEDIKVDSRYNTYLYLGLPPGPICSSGLSAIKAALDPQPTEYLFFVSKGDGTHIFSRTFKQHQEAQDKYSPTRWYFRER